LTIPPKCQSGGTFGGRFLPAGRAARPEEQVEVLRHEEVAEGPEPQSLAETAERFNKVLSKTVRVENAHATIGAGSKIA